MKPRYYLPSGEALPKQETNVHHVWFQKYKYTSMYLIDMAWKYYQQEWKEEFGL